MVLYLSAILILPSSIFRGLESDDNVTIPSAAVAFAGIIYASSGIVNVGLYLITRPAVLDFLGNVLCNRRVTAGPSPGAAGDTPLEEYSRSSVEKGMYRRDDEARSPREAEEGVAGGWRRARSESNADGRGEGSSAYAVPRFAAHDRARVSEEMVPDNYSLNGEL